MTSAKNAAEIEGSVLIRLPIDNDWYIPIREDGECAGECAEGALGFVIKLYGHAQNSFRALKVPRLLGDTYRENAYISQLLELEMQAVYSVFNQEFDNNVTISNLLSADTTKMSFLRGPISIKSLDRAEWDDAIVLVRFTKSAKPRFCLAKLGGEGRVVFYPDIQDKPAIDPETFKKLDEQARNGTMFIEMPAGERSQAVRFFSVNKAIVSDPIGTVWYAGLPSVNYVWAPRTLQETISTGDRGVWHLDQHLKLVENTCAGLRALHARGMLHADLRPANIVTHGLVVEPQSYFLSDYGSFAHSNVTTPMREVEFSQIGPVVSGERASAFYAPERRLGREREAADTAVFLNEPAGAPQITVLLGWRSDLITRKGQPDLPRIKGYLERAQTAQSVDEFVDTVLRVGDRIQIREFIFELAEDEKRVDEKQVLICKRRYWQIYHGKVAVDESRDFKPLHWMPIPRTIELLRWSVATDLYSLGALLLYSIFRHQPLPAHMNAAADSTDGTGGKSIADDLQEVIDGSKIEDQFREMLTYLNSVPYFNAIWPELDWLRFQMEQLLDDDRLNAEAFANSTFIRHDEIIDKGKRLRQSVIELTSRLTQTAPGIYQLVEALDFNLAAFIFVMHFALCCMHRQSHLREESRKGVHLEWVQIEPFCEDRHRMPGQTRATEEAYQRLTAMRGKISHPYLRNMTPGSDKKAIVKYDPRPDVSIRVELDNLRNLTGHLYTCLEDLGQYTEKAYNIAITSSFGQRGKDLVKIGDMLGVAKEMIEGTLKARAASPSVADAAIAMPEQATETRGTSMSQPEAAGVGKDEPRTEEAMSDVPGYMAETREKVDQL